MRQLFEICFNTLRVSLCAIQHRFRTDCLLYTVFKNWTLKTLCISKIDKSTVKNPTTFISYAQLTRISACFECFVQL